MLSHETSTYLSGNITFKLSPKLRFSTFPTDLWRRLLGCCSSRFGLCRSCHARISIISASACLPTVTTLPQATAPDLARRVIAIVAAAPETRLCMKTIIHSAHFCRPPRTSARNYTRLNRSHVNHCYHEPRTCRRTGPRPSRALGWVVRGSSESGVISTNLHRRGDPREGTRWLDRGDQRDAVYTV